jgi:hypothetical protein
MYMRDSRLLVKLSNAASRLLDGQAERWVQEREDRKVFCFCPTSLLIGQVTTYKTLANKGETGIDPDLASLPITQVRNI